MLKQFNEYLGQLKENEESQDGEENEIEGKVR
jgi:hypothetical protein